MAQKRAWLYSLFEKQADGSWKRIATLETVLSSARKIWQNSLLAPSFNSNLRERRLMPTRQSANSYKPGR